MNILKDISIIVSDAFEKSGYNKELGNVTISNRLDLCQFTCNGAMAGAKLYKKSPMDIANEIINNLSANNIFLKVEAVKPGFINISLTNEYYEDIVNNLNSFNDLIDPISNDTIIIDYGGPNVAKPLHVGHIRTAIIGESLKRTAKILGYNVIGDIHLGDWGLQMGLVITEIENMYPDLDYFKDDFESSETDTSPVTINELNEIYPKASEKSKQDEDYRQRAQDATKKLQNKDKGYYALWQQLVKISINDMKKSYNKLNVKFDLWYGESTCNDYVDKLIDKLVNENITYESDGALVVDVAEENDKIEIPPIIIRKSDGAQLYSTTDLATLMQRNEEFDPAQVLYVVDNRQSLHFTQVFRCAKKGNVVKSETHLEFIGFGTMNGKDGKPYKTREGGVMKLSDLIDAIIDKAYEKMKDTISDEIDEEEIKFMAENIGIAALKFGDLYNHRSRDYIFDMDRFLSFEGKTGPYLLYSIVRINSILKKSEASTGKIKLYSPTEIELVYKILLTEGIIYKSFEDKAPNYICEHVYNIATLFSKFYSENKIISETDENKRKSWISLINLTKNTIISLLDLLGINHVERM